MFAVKYYNYIIKFDGISNGSSKLKKYEIIFHILRIVLRDIFV